MWLCCDPVPIRLTRRRDVLVGAAGLALLTVTASACGPSEPKIDPLQAVQDQAVADADQAPPPRPRPPPAPAGPGAEPDRRRAHRARPGLGVEIARAAGGPPPPPPPTPHRRRRDRRHAPATVKDVVAALRRAADGAGQLAATQAGYRAGLLGSIAASRTASATVTLNAPVAAR
jgi:hypothetical protein